MLTFNQSTEMQWSIWAWAKHHIIYLLIFFECHSSAWMLLSETIFLCSSLCLCHRCSLCRDQTLHTSPTGGAVSQTGMCTSWKPLVSIHNLSASQWIIMFAKSFGKLHQGEIALWAGLRVAAYNHMLALMWWLINVILLKLNSYIYNHKFTQKTTLSSS